MAFFLSFFLFRLETFVRCFSLSCYCCISLSLKHLYVLEASMSMCALRYNVPAHVHAASVRACVRAMESKVLAYFFSVTIESQCLKKMPRVKKKCTKFWEQIEFICETLCRSNSVSMWKPIFSMNVISIHKGICSDRHPIYFYVLLEYSREKFNIEKTNKAFPRKIRFLEIVYSAPPTGRADFMRAGKTLMNERAKVSIEKKYWVIRFSMSVGH